MQLQNKFPFVIFCCIFKPKKKCLQRYENGIKNATSTQYVTLSPSSRDSPGIRQRCGLHCSFLKPFRLYPQSNSYNDNNNDNDNNEPSPIIGDLLVVVGLGGMAKLHQGGKIYKNATFGQSWKYKKMYKNASCIFSAPSYLTMQSRQIGNTLPRECDARIRYTLLGIAEYKCQTQAFVFLTPPPNNSIPFKPEKVQLKPGGLDQPSSGGG